ncbi:MAG TPA: maleylpyruvate isomerase N-terminal domain-containing protein [Acidimicrobiales bacterium]|nr:maleylpyruvate isomerase N-terminal domain-containing protein [Acidimicrobiales bacterium]
MTETIRTTFLQVAAEAAAIVGGREVGDKWNEPSTLADLQVGALAGHLARAVLTVHWYLDMPEADPPTITAGEYFASMKSDIAADENVAIRERAIEASRGGWARLYLDLGNALDHLRRRLPDERADHRIPAGGNALLLDEYLRTRVVELVIHIGDLCRSLDLAVPHMPEATNIAINVLIDTAIARHGASRVLHALSRRELDKVDALRVL